MREPVYTVAACKPIALRNQSKQQPDPHQILYAQAMRSKPETCKSIWDAIADTPCKAVGMEARGLMIDLREVIEKCGLTNAQAAKPFGITQPRSSDLIHGNGTCSASIRL